MAFIDHYRERWSVRAMCRVLEFSERTYYAAKARPPAARSVADGEHKAAIKTWWENNSRVCGARRVWRQLHRQGRVIARCTVERLMAELGIHGVQRGKRRFTTIQDASATRPPDLVKRQFTATRPNELWLADITYCSTWEGWLYV